MSTYFENPKVPMAGTRISADWGKTLLRGVQQSTLVQVPGLLMSKGRYGTAIRMEATNAVATEEKEIQAFQVRWRPYGDGRDPANGEWQIYLPLGFAILTQSGVLRNYTAKNDDGTDGNGNLDYGWMKIDTNDDDAVVTPLVDRVAKAWTVRAMFNPWPTMKAVTTAEAEGVEHPFATISVATICDIKYAKGTMTQHAVTQNHLGSVAYAWDTSGAFSIEYTLDDYSSKNPTITAKVINQRMMLGRLDRINADGTTVEKSWKTAWMKVDHSGEKFEISVEHDLTGTDAESDDDKTVVKIYDLDEGRVTADCRDSLENLEFYTNPPDTAN